MLVELEHGLAEPDRAALIRRLSSHPDVIVWPVALRGREFLVVTGDRDLVPPLSAGADRGVLAVHDPGAAGYFLVAKENAIAPERVAVGDADVGRDRPLWCAAGPCALESPSDTIETGRVLRGQGAHALRMGLFKTPHSPYHFQGKGQAGIGEVAGIAAETGLPVIAEVDDPRHVEALAEVAACLHIDPRHMTNRALLAELGRSTRPVLLMRGYTATVADWLRAAEYIMCQGNADVILCARGVVGFDDSLAFAPDVGAIQAVRRWCRLPVVYDPSHSTGRLSAVAAAALSACAFGADGLLIESYLHPERLYRPGDARQMYPPQRIGALLAACESTRKLGAALTEPDPDR